eukprot:Pgem_evm1s19645
MADSGKNKLAGVVIPSNLNKPIKRIEAYSNLLKEVARNTEDSHPDKPALSEAVVNYQQIAEAAARVRKLKEFERSVLLSDVEGLPAIQIGTLGNLEYFINVLSPSAKDNNLRERVILVFKEVVLILNKFYKVNKTQYKLRDRLPLAGVHACQYDEGDYDFAFVIYSNGKNVLVGTCNSETERDESITAILQSASLLVAGGAGYGAPNHDISSSNNSGSKKTIMDTFRSLRKQAKSTSNTMSSNNEPTNQVEIIAKPPTMRTPSAANQLSGNQSQVSNNDVGVINNSVLTPNVSATGGFNAISQISSPTLNTVPQHQSSTQQLSHTANSNEVISYINSLQSQVDAMKLEMKMLKETLAVEMRARRATEIEHQNRNNR